MEEGWREEENLPELDGWGGEGDDQRIFKGRIHQLGFTEGGCEVLAVALPSSLSQLRTQVRQLF